MADNTVLNTGVGGDTIATDDIAGVKYERVKVNFGADGAATDVSSAAPLPVDTELTTSDLDTGGGVDTRAVVGLVRAESGGGLLVGTANPLPVNDAGGSLTVDGTVTANTAKAATSTRTQVASAAVDTLVLAANANRLGATIENDDANELYLGLGTTAASLTNYTVIIPNKGYYEIPFDFTGQVRGIWAVDGAGSARISELTT